MCSTERNLGELTRMLPPPRLYDTEYGGKEFAHGYLDEVSVAVEKLDEAVDGCPACMMAAIRQAKIPVPAVPNFNFSERCKDHWNAVNDARHDSEYRY